MLVVLIEFHIHAIVSQRLRKLANTSRMRWIVLAVANEEAC